MRVLDVMSADVVTVAPSDRASAAWTRMRRRGIHHLVVVDGSRVVGVLSERDLGGASGASTRKDRVVKDLMTPRVESIESDASVDDAAAMMRARLIGSLPVMDGTDLVGIITATDVFEALRHASASDLPRPTTRSAEALRHAKVSDLPRPSARSSENGKRGAFTDEVPRPAKRKAGRTTATQVPANIRVAGVELTDDDRDYIRKRLGMKLGKFALAIERVTVRISDINGTRGGVDKVCNIKVVLSALPSVVFESRSATLRIAVNSALSGVERSVRRSLDKRRSKPLKGVSDAKAGR